MQPFDFGRLGPNKPQIPKQQKQLKTRQEEWRKKIHDAASISARHHKIQLVFQKSCPYCCDETACECQAMNYECNCKARECQLLQQLRFVYKWNNESQIKNHKLLSNAMDWT